MKRGKVIVCVSLEEAREHIKEMLRNGWRWADITKVTFKIGDRYKRFNPREISEINKLLLLEQKPKLESSNIDEEEATILALLRKNMNPVDIAIQTNIKLDRVIAVAQKYYESENLTPFPKPLLGLILKFDRDCYNLGGAVPSYYKFYYPRVGIFLNKAVENFKILEKLCFDCPVEGCYNLHVVNKYNVDKLRKFLISRAVCSDCANSYHRDQYEDYKERY